MTLYLYFSIFLISILSLIFAKLKETKINKDDIYKFLAILLCLLASFRWKVGGDWETYLITYERSQLEMINFNWSIIFEFLNYFFSLLNTGVYGVNLTVSSLFFIAIYRLSKSLNFDLLLMLVISVSLIYYTGIMGYVRQTLALTFIIFSLDLHLRNKKNLSIILFSLSTFTHISIIFLPIFLSFYLKNFKTLILIIIISILCLILGFSIFKVAFNEFILKGMISMGAIFRSIPLLICCLIYILFRKSFFVNFKNFEFIIFYLFLLSIILIILTFLSPSLSAIADRLSFFMTIYQILVIGLLFKNVIKPNNNFYLHYAIFVSIFYFLVTFTWFIFGDYSIYWLDYRFIF